MPSSSSTPEQGTAKLEQALQALCRIYSQALEAVTAGNLEGAAARGDEATALVGTINKSLTGEPSPREMGRCGQLADQARTLHGQIMAVLEEGRRQTARQIKESKTFHRALNSYRDTLPKTGGRLDITDS